MEQSLEILQTLQNIQSMLEMIITILLGFGIFFILKMLINFFSWITG